MMRFFNYVALSVVFFVLSMTLAPASIWYQVHTVQVGESHAGTPAPVSSDRTAHYDFQGSYQVIIRGVDGMDAVCDTKSGVFTYYAGKTLVKDDMAWWAPGDTRCSNLPAGEYIMETTWSIHGLMWGLVPTKRVKAYSNIFTVLP